jgi:hypothetical protein
MQFAHFTNTLSLLQTHYTTSFFGFLVDEN